MAEQALKKKDSMQDDADKPLSSSSPSMRGNAAASGAPATPVAQEKKEVSEPQLTDSFTYQQNRKAILAALQTIPVNYQPFGQPNLVKDRYQIEPHKELSEFHRTHAKAYAARDVQHPEKEYVAYVCAPYFPARHGVVQALKGQHIRHVLELIEAGIAFIEPWQENRMVLIYERPQGVTLESVITQQPYCSPIDAVKQIVVPIAAAMAKMASSGVVHGSINPRNIYVHEKNLVLGECAAEPASMDHPAIYEPLERLSAEDGLRGVPTRESDIYALAVLVLDACGFLGNKKLLTRQQLLPAYYARGAYNVLVDETAVPYQLLDMMRGALTDNPTERWGMEQLVNFAAGKKYNLIPVNAPRDTTRAYPFAGTDYVTLRSLAYGYTTQWDSSIASIKDVKFVKWMDTITYKNDMKEKIERMHVRASRSAAKGKGADEIIAKTITTLDPYGALRVKQTALTASALPYALCVAFKDGDLGKQLALREIVEFELAGYWRDAHDYNYSKLSYSPEVIRALLQVQSAGFGMERVLYEVNAELPCMSRNYARYYALNVKTMLMVLESVAKEKAAHDKLYDKHLLAFIAARANINKEVKIKDFRDYPELQNNNELSSIVLLAMAQEKAKIESLPALCCWAGLRVAEMIEHFHSYEVRQHFSRDIQAILPRGRLSYLVRVLQNRDYIMRDVQGHQKAIATFQRNTARIAQFRDKAAIKRRAERGGLRVALGVSLSILCVVTYIVMAKYIL
jgi:serine/threonine protein kinase